MTCSHKLLECNRVNLYEQVVHSVMEYPDFTEPLSLASAGSFGLHAVEVQYKYRLFCSHRSKIHNHDLGGFDLGLTYDQGQFCLLKVNRAIYKET